MKRTRIAKAAAVLMALTLVAIALGVPNIALAAAGDVTITYTGSVTTLAVGETKTLTGVIEGGTEISSTYSWSIDSGSSVTLPSTTTTKEIVITAASVGTTRIALTAADSAISSSKTVYLDVTVVAFSVTEDSVTIMPTNTATLTPNNYTGTITWGTGSSSVATVSSAGVVTAVSGGATTITAYNTVGGVTQSDTTTVYVPVVTLSPSSQTISTASTTTTLTLTVTNGGSLVPDGTIVTWNNSNTTAGSISTTSSTVSGGTSSISFTSNSTGTNASTTITASLSGLTRTATVTVQTSRYLTIEGPTSLDKTTRTGIYTVYLHNADGTIVNDSTSTVHWSWSKSYLSITSNDLNDRRADMHGGEAHIELYARYNTPSSGTKLYAWINDDYDDRESITINITGLSSLPQTGQDFTLPYVFAGLGGALLIAAGVWYGIRKKRSEKA